MDAAPEGHEAVPPGTEQIHLPDSSYLPVVLALALTVALVGIVVNLVLCAIGVIVSIPVIFRWYAPRTGVGCVSKVA